MNELTLKYKEDKSTWDNFLLTSAQRSIFLHSKFLDSLNINYDLVTCYSKNKILAGCVFLYNDSGELIQSSFPFTQYQGLLLSDNHHKNNHSRISHEFKVVEFFLDSLAKHFKNITFCNSWRFYDLRPFQWFNYHENNRNKFKLDLRYTGVLDLTKFNDFGSYLSTIRTVRRQEFKKSSKLIFEFSCDISILDMLHKKTFDRQSIQRNANDSFLLKSISKASIFGGYGKLGIVFLDKKPISASLFLYDDRSAFYLFGANDPEYRQTGAGTFLMLHMIKDAMQKGISEIDFCGINSPNRGDFKISFNADPKAFFVCTYTE